MTARGQIARSRNAMPLSLSGLADVIYARDTFAVDHERDDRERLSVHRSNRAELAVDPDQTVVHADEVACDATLESADAFRPTQRL